MGLHQQGDCDQGVQLLRLLQNDAVDAAIEAGLMDYVPCPACEPQVTATVLQTQQRLASAWAARERYAARNARLARRTAEREQKRQPVAAAEKQTSLPPAAAAILARAKAKAAARGKS